MTLGAYYDVSLGAFYDKKWTMLQSRGARQINDSFLGWLARRRSDRPFFAFLNYFDAHDPFIPPADFKHRFGIAPTTREDYHFLFDYALLRKESQGERKLRMAFDSYNTCISFLDEQLDQLLCRLQEQKLLENTTVIITSDHGEGFGDHGFYGHLYGLSLEEIGVPLVVLSPGAPAGKRVHSAVSLRDLPATVVDLAGAGHGSPFPGSSLRAGWSPRQQSTPARELKISPAFSEQADSTILEPKRPHGRGPGEFQMSLVAQGKQYIRDRSGTEHLFDLTVDPFETENLMRRPDGEKHVREFRKMLLDFLASNRGSHEVEHAYLRAFREQLRSAVEADTEQSSRNPCPDP